ncbi:MAG: TonB-dependent receptor [Burkholderiales bacterium PBB3]|nr:MAG: TonB-dependent receptor [Burkholderiales bacterium PBB3]
MLDKVFSGNRWGSSPFLDSAVVALVLCCGIACAGETANAAKYRIDQPAQPLGESLRAIARQTGVSIVFDPGKVSGRTSRSVLGHLTAAEAIARALEGSGLAPTVMSDGSIVVRPAATPGPSGPASGPGVVPGSAPELLPRPSGRAEAVADAASIRSMTAFSSQLVDSGSTPSDEGHGSVTSLGRIEVTGSRLKRIEADGPTPVNVYTRGDIDRSGQPTLERFLSSLNEASVSPGESSFVATTGQGSVQLRGLPLGSTLVLINGRRLQAVGSSSANFFNLNLIPMAAVDRIEIVPVGSSAVYGGDALAGVVNIILKKSIDGWVLDARLASGQGSGDGSLSMGTGTRTQSGSYIVLGAYNKSSPLTMAERDFFVDADYRRFGGVDARTRSCTPGTVSSSTGANLPGLNSSFAAIPVLAPGQAPTLASFAAGAGQANLCNSMANGKGRALVHGTESLSFHVAGDYRLSDAWSVFGEWTHAKDKLSAEEGGLLLSNVLVPATNPHNLFGVPVRVTARLGPENGLERLARDTDFNRALVGLRGDLPSGWELEASLSSTRDDGQRRLSNTTPNVAARTAALATSNAAAALNPFTVGKAANDDVLQAIWSDSIRDNHGRKDQVSAFLRGSVLELPMGSVDLIAGAETAQDRYQTVSPGSFDIAARRSNSAAYGELHLPLWRSSPGEGATREMAALTLAARRDRYSDFGSASTYQAGAEFRPSKTTLLRASTATSFKPPTLLQTKVDDLRYSTEAFGLLDPARANAPIVGGEVLRTTNRELKPESGRAFAVGAVWEPESAQGTRLGVTAWRVKIDGLISLLWPQVVLANEARFPGFVTRAPAAPGQTGAVTRVLYAEVNYGGVDTSGLDLELAHAWKTEASKWTLSASATRTRDYDVTLAPGAPTENRLGRRAIDFWSPAWKGRLFAGLDRGAWNLGLTSRYLGSYRDALPSERRLGGYWIHDLAATFKLAPLGLSFASSNDTTVSLAVANIANRLPEFVETSPFYDFTQGDWRGRYLSLRLSMRW